MECGARADGALNLDLAGMFLDDAVRHRKSEPGAATVTRLRHCLRGEKRIVDSLQMLGSDTTSAVRDDCFNVPVYCRGNAEIASAWHCLFSVEQEIQKHLLQLPGIAVDRRKLRVQIEIDLNLRGLELMLQQRKRVADYLVQVRRTKFSR